MSRFKVGDKVRRIGYSDRSFGMFVGDVYTISYISGSGWLKVVETDQHAKWDIGLFELVKEEDVKQFDLKTDEWYIKCNTQEQFNSSQEWLFEQGFKWESHDQKVMFSDSIEDGYDCLHGDTKGLLWRTDECGIQDRLPNAKEIKLTFKTVVDSVEYPSLETEQEKLIRELQETINKAEEQIKELKGDK